MKVATRIGRRGRIRRATSTPTIIPTASPASTADHAGAPPSSALATTGPSTPCAACSAITSTENCATTTQSHWRERNSFQPSFRSENTDCSAVSRWSRVSRSDAISTAATLNISALTANDQPAPSSTTAAPLITTPVTLATFAPSPSRALAVCRFGVLTTSGMMPVSAGNKIAVPMPPTAAAAVIHATGAHPDSSMAAKAPNAIAFRPSPTIITRLRWNRSAITPPISRNSTTGMASPASTMDSVPGVAPGSASTPKASATGAKELPSIEIVRAASNRSNRRSRSRARSRPATAVSKVGGRSGGPVGTERHGAPPPPVGAIGFTATRATYHHDGCRVLLPDPHARSRTGSTPARPRQEVTMTSKSDRLRLRQARRDGRELRRAIAGAPRTMRDELIVIAQRHDAI